jgi:hypothetical protein
MQGVKITGNGGTRSPQFAGYLGPGAVPKPVLADQFDDLAPAVDS